MMQAMVKIAVISALACLLGGCSATFVPISWGFGEKVQHLSRSDLTLVTLYNRYDPQRQTLRVGGESFNEVMMPSEVEHHLGAYRQDTKLIYRNLYHEFGDNDLRDLMVHELAHHIWFIFMSPQQRNDWQEHLALNPSPLQGMVRSLYSRPADHDPEDFAFTVEYARPIDIEELARLKIINDQERDAILKERHRDYHRAAPRGSALLSAAGPDLSQQGPQLNSKGIESGK
jgi:hypothetical protein